MKSNPLRIQKINPNKAVMIWGAITKESKSQLFFKLSQFIITAESYCEILNTHLKPFYKKDMIFIQDNAPAHSAKTAKTWFTENNISIKKHPPKSPDLNPIETIWYIMKSKMESYSFQIIDELKSLI